MAAFALITPQRPLWLVIPLLAVFGMVNSIQFTAMNTVTLKDLSGTGASSGNSMLSMVQMLSMSLAVTSAGALLATFEQGFGKGSSGVLPAFHATFICMGLITCASAWIFMQLAPQEAKVVAKVQHAGEV